MARRPYVSPEALYSSIMDSVGYLEIYSLKREYLPIFQSHRIKPIKPFRHGIYAFVLGFDFHSRHLDNIPTAYQIPECTYCFHFSLSYAL